MTSYGHAMRFLAEGRIVILTPGIDRDGEDVVCISGFETRAQDVPHLRHPDGNVRACYLLCFAMAARQGLRERHGIKCA